MSKKRIRRRQNPDGFSERKSWEFVLRHKDNPREIAKVAKVMLAQLKRGVHKNPVIGIVNPPRVTIVRELSKRAYDLAYKHSEDKKDYWHDFQKGCHVSLLSDGNVILWHPTKRIWRRFPRR